MPIGQSTFTADNIVAVLAAAPKGGTVEQVVERSGCDASAASVKKWISDGKRDRKNGKDTAYGLFADQWEAVYPGAPPRGEPERMAEMQKALERLGISPSQNGHQANGSAPARQRAPRGSRKVCECGNEKDASAVACPSCMALDTRK